MNPFAREQRPKGASALVQDSGDAVSAAGEADSTHARRHFLVTATAAMGVTGVGFALYPFVASMWPSQRAQALGGPVQIDVTKVQPGSQVTVVWRGQPIWILRRTQETLSGLANTQLVEQLRDPDSRIEAQQPSYAVGAYRSIDPEYLVVTALCTHLGCVPTYRPEIATADLGSDWMGGYYCPCHGSKFDLAGRVFNNMPAPTNLVVPPYRFVSAGIIEIGVDPV